MPLRVLQHVRVGGFTWRIDTYLVKFAGHFAVRHALLYECFEQVLKLRGIDQRLAGIGGITGLRCLCCISRAQLGDCATSLSNIAARLGNLSLDAGQ